MNIISTCNQLLIEFVIWHETINIYLKERQPFIGPPQILIHVICTQSSFHGVNHGIKLWI
jgi:hypothetical protein